MCVGTRVLFCDRLGHTFQAVISRDYDQAVSICNCFLVWKSNIHICRPYMSLCSYILALCYAHYAINVDANTFYFNYVHCIVITFSFSYNYYVNYAAIETKTLFFLLIIKSISPLRLLRQDLEKLHIVLFHYYYYVHYRVILTKKYYFDFRHFYFSTTYRSSTTFTMS